MDANHSKTPPRTPAPSRPQRLRSRPADTAFDLWLERGLHRLYDHVAFDPVPPSLLRLIQESWKE